LAHPDPSRLCLEPDLLAAWVDGTLDADASRAVIAHLADCAECRTLAASLAGALADPTVSREVAKLEGRRPRWVYPISISAAAAAAVLLVLLPGRPSNRLPDHRAPTITAGAAPTALAPVGTVAGAPMLQWSSVPGAGRYRVTLFDAQGRVLFETSLTDTAVALPDSLRLAPGKRLLWKVEARVGYNRWVSSPLIEFSIGEPVPP
jgi:putative zinc finger protein